MTEVERITESITVKVTPSEKERWMKIVKARYANQAALSRSIVMEWVEEQEKFAREGFKNARYTK